MSDSFIIQLNKAINKEEQERYLAAGATDEQIRSFREGLGDELSRRLPESFYAFYGWHNGSAQVGEVPFHDGEPLLSLEHIVSSWRNWKEVAEGGSFSQYVEGAWWDAAWVPYIETDWYVQVIDTKGSFFRAQERLDHFLAHIRQQIETLQQIPQPNLLHQLALAILSDILQDI